MHEAVGGQPVGDGVAGGFRVRLLGRVHTHAQVLRQLDIVVAVDAEHFLHHVAFAGHVDTVSRNGD